MSGIFGVEGSGEDNKVISLGFLVTDRIKNEYYDELKWNENIQIKIRSSSGESRFFCNKKPEKRTFFIPYKILRGL